MLEKLFGFNPKEMSLKTEIMAGITTFLTMAYILAVNPSILGETGMDKGALFTTTVLVSSSATILMGIYAKLPFALAPGMGLNAFFAYTICASMGYSWQFALTAVFLEGLIFIFLTVSNLREKLVYILPDAVKTAISAGIGLYIAFIGLKSAEVIVDHPSTLVCFGKLNAASALGLAGIVITAALLIKKVKGGLLFGILLTTLAGIPFGVTRFDGIFSAPPSIEPIFFKFEWAQIFTKEMAIVVLTFLFVDLFGAIGTIIGVANSADTREGGKIINLNRAFLVDAIATTGGAMMGSSTVTTFVESAVGVKEGGRSGITAVVCGLCFLSALFLAPLFLAIPASATAPVLVLVGLMMVSGSVSKIDFSDYSEAVPAFLCIIFMPLSYSISEGIVIGHLSYVLINLCCGRVKKISVSMCALAIFFMLKFFL